MTSWWQQPSSLNWQNKKKLAQNIREFENNISQSKNQLLLLLATINSWDNLCKELLEKGSQQQLTSKNLVELKPLLERSKEFNSILQTLCSELKQSPLSENDFKTQPELF